MSTDEDLARRGAAGDAAALNEIVQRHQRAVRLFLRRMCGDPARADDLAQDTFLAAFSALPRYRGEADLGAWLCGIAYRKFLSDQRSAARRRARDAAALIDDAPASGPDARLDIATAFAALSEEQRAAAALCLLEDMSHTEAARALGLPLGTLKSRVASAKTRLTQALKDYR